MKKRLFVVGIVIVLILSLTACKSNDYKEAVQFQNEAKYEEALELYGNIGNEYKDVEDRVAECQSYIDAIKEYDLSKQRVEEMNSNLEEKITEAETLANSTEIALDETLRPALETTISSAKAAKFEVSEIPSELSEIKGATDSINGVNYDDVLNELQISYDALDKSIKQYALVNNPKEAYVIERLSKVENIVDISAVTEDNDPNGNLNKAGGYTAQVYFSCDLVNQADVSGNTVIDKGTDCGGSVEVYSTPEDATKRNDYLATYDGTIFASGSHTVIGTCLIRTSDKLTASQQTEIETAIISQLTAIE